MIDRENVIEHLKKIAEYFRKRRSNLSFASKAENHFWELQNAASEAAELLKAQEPRVMTLEEIEDALDNVVWLDIPGAENLADGFSLIMAYSRKYGFVLLDSPFGDNPSQDRFEYTDYNKTWRCWTSRPTDEQRKATPWEPPKGET